MSSAVCSSRCQSQLSPPPRAASVIRYQCDPAALADAGGQLVKSTSTVIRVELRGHSIESRRAQSRRRATRTVDDRAAEISALTLAKLVPSAMQTLRLSPASHPEHTGKIVPNFTLNSPMGASQAGALHLARQFARLEAQLTSRRRPQTIYACVARANAFRWREASSIGGLRPSR